MTSTLDLIIQNSEIATLLASKLYVAAEIQLKIILTDPILLKLTGIEMICPSVKIGIPSNYMALIYQNSDYTFLIKSSIPQVGDYVTIDINRFLGIYITIGEILSNLVVNAGAWVTDGMIIGSGGGELYVQTVDVKMKGIISLLNEVGLVNFRDIIVSFYSQEWGIIEADTILPRYHMYLDNQRMIQ